MNGDERRWNKGDGVKISESLINRT
jgi:hypothetical protein